ncbi:MAG: amidohydrolase [Acidimicrobiales bacterium]|nr:amidohydrolase [Acidimicrobiales bacterium]
MTTTIDVDGHVFEEDDIWERYLPARFHDRRPRMIVDERGTTRYVIEDNVIPQGTGRGAWVPEGMRESTTHREGGVDVAARLADMETEGIDIAVLYGAVSLGFYAMNDRELCVASCRAYNDWLHDWCSADPARLRGTPSLPLKWMDDAVAEAERCVADLGFVSLTVPCAVGDRNPDHRDNDALYALAQELDVPLGFHAGGCRFAHSRFVDSYAQLHAVEFPFNLMFALTNLLCSGVLERFPTLRLALLEGGVGWVPFQLERLDEHVEHRRHEFPGITCLPSERFAEGRVFVSTEGERGLPQVIEQIGVDSIVWASDYPHWDSEFPTSVTSIADRDDLSAEQCHALFDANPRRLLGWPAR